MYCILLHDKNQELIINPIKCFPAVKGLTTLKGKIHPFYKFNILDINQPWSKNLLIISGDKVVQHDHVKILSSLNRLVQASLITTSDGYADTGWRMLFFYIFIWDGLLFEVTSSQINDYEINEIDYGVYEYYYPIKISTDANKYLGVGHKLLFSFGNRHYIEIAKPKHMINILDNIENTLQSLTDDFLSNWGLKHDEMI